MVMPVMLCFSQDKADVFLFYPTGYLHCLHVAQMNLQSHARQLQLQAELLEQFCVVPVLHSQW
jgi:hypothetical protein